MPPVRRHTYIYHHPLRKGSVKKNRMRTKKYSTLYCIIHKQVLYLQCKNSRTRKTTNLRQYLYDHERDCYRKHRLRSLHARRRRLPHAAVLSGRHPEPSAGGRHGDDGRHRAPHRRNLPRAGIVAHAGHHAATLRPERRKTAIPRRKRTKRPPRANSTARGPNARSQESAADWANTSTPTRR